MATNKWFIDPQEWPTLPRKQQRRILKVGFQTAGKVLLGLVIFGLVVETALGL